MSDRAGETAQTSRLLQGREEKQWVLEHQSCAVRQITQTKSMNLRHQSNLKAIGDFSVIYIHIWRLDTDVTRNNQCRLFLEPQYCPSPGATNKRFVVYFLPHFVNWRSNGSAYSRLTLPMTAQGHRERPAGDHAVDRLNTRTIITNYGAVTMLN